MELGYDFDPPCACLSVGAFLHSRNDCRPDVFHTRYVLLPSLISGSKDGCRRSELTSSRGGAQEKA